MLVLKEFANFITLNMADLTSTYAHMLADSSSSYSAIPANQRLASGRKLLKAVIAACTQQTSIPLLTLFQSPSARWTKDITTSADSYLEVECLGQTLTPVVTNLEAGKFLWQLLYEARAAVTTNTNQATIAPSATLSPAKADTPAELGTSEAPLLRTLIDNLPDHIYIKDTQSRFLLVNDIVRRHLGAATAEDVIGKTDFDFSPKKLAEQYYADEQKLFQSGQSLIDHEESIFDHETGQSRWVSSTKVLFKDSTGKIAGLVGLNRDITDRKITEAKLARLATQLQTVAQVGGAISTILDTEKLLQSVVDLTKEQFDLYHAHIYLYDESQDALLLTAGAGTVGKKLLQQAWAIPLDKEASLVASSARERAAVVVNDVRQSQDYFQNPLLPDTRSEMAVPMIAGRQLLGVLDVQSDESDHFDADAERIYMSLASQVAVAVRNANLYRQTQETLSETSLLYQASAVLNTAQSYSEILDVLRQYTILGQNAQNISLNYFDTPWTENIRPDWIEVLARWTQLPQDAVNNRYLLATFSSANQVLKADEPVIIENVETDDRLDDNARRLYAHQFGAKSTIFVPLVVAGEWIGFINAIFQQSIRFSSENVRRVMALSAQAAVAIQSIQRLIRTQRQARREHTIREITDKMRNAASLDELVKVAATQLGDHFAAEYTLVELGMDSAAQPSSTTDNGHNIEHSVDYSTDS